MNGTGERAPAPDRLWAAAILALAFLAHARSLGSDFVYDAVAQLREDDFVHTPANLADVLTLRVMGRDVLDFNRPIHLLSLMLDAAVWGRTPFGFHLTSVLLHGACAGLLFGLLRGWLRRQGVTAVGPAALPALLFAVHPLGVEAVAEPSYREELLVGLFLLLALRLTEAWPTARRRWLVGGGIVACAFLAVAAKESGVVVLAAVVASWWIGHRQEPARPWLALCLACTAVTAAFVVARFALEPDQSAVFRERAHYLGGSFGAAMAIQPRIWTLYLAHLVWPVGLSADYTAASIAGIPTALAVVAVLAVLGLQILGARRSSLLAWSLVLFWGGLLPASNLFPMYRPAADRYLYVPLAGVACAAAALLAWAWPRRPRLVAVLSAAALVSLAGSGVRRQGVFASELALWTDTVRVNPTSVTAMNNLGWALLDVGRADEARQQFDRTLQATRGRAADAQVGRALALAETGQTRQAVAALAAAVQRDPVYADPAALARTLRLGKAHRERLLPLLARLPAGP